MTREVKAIAPSQPTVLARNVETILPSRFASVLTFVRTPPAKKSNNSNSNNAPSDDTGGDDEPDFDPDPTIEISTGTENATTVSPAPAKVELCWFLIPMSWPTTESIAPTICS
jgi:hypothetical protein